MFRAQTWCGPPEGVAREATSRAVTADELHAEHLEAVFRYVSRRVERREEAEDLTAEVFAAAFAALPRFRGDCPPRLWLLSIARRKLVDLARRRRTRPETLASDLSVPGELDRALEALSGAVDGPEQEVLRAEARQVVRGLLLSLKEEQREALLLQHVDGLSVSEIAVVLGRSPAAANSLLQRARATLYQRGKDFFGTQEERR